MTSKPDPLSSRTQDARKELDTAVAELQEKAGLVDALHDKLLGVNNTLAFFDSELQVRPTPPTAAAAECPAGL